MNKQEIAAFFDRCAPKWDENIVKDDAKLNTILDAAGVGEASVVLDVACGTGVLFPYYLARNVAQVTAVDISPEMVRVAKEKTEGTCITVLCGDAQELDLPGNYDCCVIYNAFPHFTEPEALIARIASLLRPGGTLCIAHGMSLAALHQHHKRARNVSRDMFTAEELGAMLAPYFDVETSVSDDEKFVVAGKKR